IGKVLSFLREWDRGDRTVRSRMLNTFLSRNTGKTFYELELEFAQVASLFLARLSTWMRLRYMFGTFLGLQLKAIGIFLSASSDQYLMEFTQDGGVLTLLDIVSHSQSKEEDKAEALRLLITVSSAGRRYKEIICESHVKVTAECFATSNTDECQETALALLDSLSHGNPKYQDQIYKSLIALLACGSPKAQQLVLHTLHTLQCCPLEAEMIKMSGSLSVFVQQAAAAKTILLSEEDRELSRELLSLGVIQHLLHAMGNREHADAQIQASRAL
uniref:Armadillo like helical domain containing 1 n=1 Tax=Stegastes partitus TaxID=144197 RepID=A0A3B4YY25_9TELE